MGWSAADIPDMSGNMAVITGANSGLGFEAAAALARRGASVLMAVRDMQRGTAAVERIQARVPGAELELRELDLGSLASVRSFAAAITTSRDVIDILLNNAGLMAMPAGETADGFETQMGTNHYGHFVLTQALLPALEAAEGARVVTMTSVARIQGRTLADGGGRLGKDYDPWQAYGDSKLANYQFGIELARRLEAAGSSVSSLVAHPGLANTNLQAASVANAGSGWQGRMWHVLARTVGMPPSQGVLPGLRAATDPGATNGEVYGPRWNLRGAAVRISLEERRVRPADTERMWRVSEAMTGTTFDLEAGRQQHD
jgi:NAD(P)-dependent dehydrogenase (short-subunit alcohol dehydrogenase family)